MISDTAKRWLRIAAALLGAALLAAAIYVALRQVDYEQVRAASPWLLLALAPCVTANLLLTGLLFWVVTLSFDATPTVGPRRMVALICASALLNYLPLRAGLIGRAGYLKVRHALPIRQSLIILGIVLALGAVVLGLTAAAVLLGPRQAEHGMLMMVIVGLLTSSVVMPSLARMAIKREAVAAWAWLPLRVADMLVGGLRLWLALWIFGSPLSLPQAIAAGAAGMLVSLIGITPNGIGMREWLIALLAEAVAPMSGPAGLAASLVDRAVEAVVSVVAGAAAMRELNREPLAA